MLCHAFNCKKNGGILSTISTLFLRTNNYDLFRIKPFIKLGDTAYFLQRAHHCPTAESQASTRNNEFISILCPILQQRLASQQPT